MALKVLSALDTARTQLYHFKAIVVAGMGLFSDAYDLFCFPAILRFLGWIYYPGDAGQENESLYEVPAAVISGLIGSVLLGTVVGQLVFGCLGDLVGRRRVYGITLMLMVVSSFASGLSLSTTRPFVLASLIFFRFFLGVGIGGDYPLSATIMSEFANKTTRGGFIAAVFSMQGFGILLSSVVTVVMCAIFNAASHDPPSSHHVPMAADLAWRLILIIGAIPATLTFYWRMKMPETARFTALVENNTLQAAKDMERVLKVSLSQIAEDVEMASSSSTRKTASASDSATANLYPLLSKEFFRRHGRDLFASATNWLLVDVVFYSLNLFQSHAYRRDIPLRRNMNAYEDALHIAKYQAIMAICSTIPGYFVAVYSIDRIGRVKIQIMGFFFMALSLLTIGIVFHNHWDEKPNIWFMVLNGAVFFFSNFGPNTTTFIIPAELFPARFRTTCHGISGAAGKVGAIIGSVGFVWLSKDDGKGIGMNRTLMVMGSVCVAGMLNTYLFTRETAGRSLEKNESEDELTGIWVLRTLPSFNECHMGTSAVAEGEA